jgi:AcrR family transcriptional regulator
MAVRARRGPQRDAGPDGRLSSDRIVDAAIALADEDGLDAVSMRKLGQRLGVDPMSLYHHVRDKGTLLSAMVDAVVATIPVADDHGRWAESARATILGARSVVLRHPWAPAAIAALPSPTPAVLSYLDAVLGMLRAAGFSVALTHHALHVLGSRILGFSQDLYNDDPSARSDPPSPVLAAQMASTLPHLAELAGAVTHEGGLGGCDDDEEFAFALDLILDGLEARRTDAVVA